MRKNLDNPQYRVCPTCETNLFFNFFKEGATECIICTLRKQEENKQKKEKSFVDMPNCTA